jgi:hypothetical protein
MQKINLGKETLVPTEWEGEYTQNLFKTKGKRITPTHLQQTETPVILPPVPMNMGLDKLQRQS